MRCAAAVSSNARRKVVPALPAPVCGPPDWLGWVVVAVAVVRIVATPVTAAATAAAAAPLLNRPVADAGHELLRAVVEQLVVTQSRCRDRAVTVSTTGEGGWSHGGMGDETQCNRSLISHTAIGWMSVKHASDGP
eukprot:COSAG06_NODE_57_length_27525_cov_14.855279_20_plen_135_part_00